MKISVLIPTKNEPLINDLVREAHRVLRKQNHEIIVIDKSKRRPKVIGAKLIDQKSDGLGNAVVEGASHAAGDVLVVMDADFSHDPNDIPKLLKKIKTYDIVIGSRFIRGGKTEDKFFRRVVAFCVRKYVSFVLGLKIKDNQSGFAAIRTEVFKKLDLHPIGYKINMEILYKAKDFNFKATEVPITFHKRKAGESKVGFNISGLKELSRIFIYTIRLKLGLQ